MTSFRRQCDKAVFGNVGTLIAFRIGYTDAEVMEKEFGKTFTATTLADLARYEAVVKLLVEGSNLEPFRARMSPPLENRIGRKDNLIALSRERFAMPRGLIEDKLKRVDGRGQIAGVTNKESIIRRITSGVTTGSQSEVLKQANLRFMIGAE